MLVESLAGLSGVLLSFTVSKAGAVVLVQLIIVFSLPAPFIVQKGGKCTVSDKV